MLIHSQWTGPTRTRRFVGRCKSSLWRDENLLDRNRRIMGKFSERVGAVPPRQIQHAVMDDALRVGIWNWLLWALDKSRSSSSDSWSEEYWYKLAKAGLWDEILHKPAD